MVPDGDDLISPRFSCSLLCVDLMKVMNNMIDFDMQNEMRLFALTSNCRSGNELDGLL